MPVSYSRASTAGLSARTVQAVDVMGATARRCCFTHNFTSDWRKHSLYLLQVPYRLYKPHQVHQLALERLTEADSLVYLGNLLRLRNIFMISVLSLMYFPVSNTPLSKKTSNFRSMLLVHYMITHFNTNLFNSYKGY